MECVNMQIMSRLVTESYIVDQISVFIEVC
jgi:hypothetical protein